MIDPMVKFTTSIQVNGRERRKMRVGLLSELKKYLMLKGKYYRPALHGIGTCMVEYRNGKLYADSDAIRDIIEAIGVGVRYGKKTQLIYYGYDACGTIQKENVK